jgi:hypothetical protein
MRFILEGKCLARVFAAPQYSIKFPQISEVLTAILSQFILEENILAESLKSLIFNILFLYKVQTDITLLQI